MGRRALSRFCVVVDGSGGVEIWPERTFAALRNGGVLGLAWL